MEQYKINNSSSAAIQFGRFYFNHIQIKTQDEWRFPGGKSVNVNAVENGSQSFKEVKDIR